MTASGNRRWWLIGLVAVWIAGLVGVIVWSVGHDRATVPEQRDIDLAVADLQRAAGVVYVAASGDDRAVILNELQLARGCRITPVRSGTTASRTVTVYVPDGEAVAAVEQIAARLPAGYQAEAGPSRGGTRVSLHADAGNFIGIDLSAEAVASAVTLRLSTGCRPDSGDGNPAGGEPSAPAPPALLGQVAGALGARLQQPSRRVVTCPSGATAGSYTVTVESRPEDLVERLRDLAGDAEVVRADDQARAYLSGADSLVVVPDEQGLSVTVSTGCQ